VTETEALTFLTVTKCDTVTGDQPLGPRLADQLLPEVSLEKGPSDVMNDVFVLLERSLEMDGRV
jgi:hypothetical protein